MYTWNLDTGVREGAMRSEHVTTAMCFLEQIDCLVCGDEDGMFTLWFVRPSKFRSIKALRFSNEEGNQRGAPVTALGVDEENGYLVSGNGRGDVCCFDLRIIEEKVAAWEAVLQKYLPLLVILVFVFFLFSAFPEREGSLFATPTRLIGVLC